MIILNVQTFAFGNLGVFLMHVRCVLTDFLNSHFFVRRP